VIGAAITAAKIATGKIAEGPNPPTIDQDTLGGKPWALSRCLGSHVQETEIEGRIVDCAAFSQVIPNFANPTRYMGKSGGSAGSLLTSTVHAPPPSRHIY
jgi:hypothetical protein